MAYQYHQPPQMYQMTVQQTQPGATNPAYPGVYPQLGPPVVANANYPPPPPGAAPIILAPPPQQQSDPNIPPGLEYLTVIDQLLVQQKIEMLEAFTGWETNNKYAVKNSMGQNVYYAVEDNDCCTRQCCGPARSFDMKIFDNYRREIMNIHRPLRCNSCCTPCCNQELEVYSISGQQLGSIHQDWSICTPQFSVKSGASGETVLKISGPFLTMSCCKDVVFDVLTRDRETKVGKITKQWSGFTREAFTDADLFGVTFPLDLDVQVKATLLAATFLIDFMFFESTDN